ncbi:MAG: potassium channel family protein [Chloroflexota bacterium]
MYVIIIGAGEVGRYLGRELIEMGHEVLIIEKNRNICEELTEELGSIFLCGDGCEVSVLRRAGITRAEMFIAVTDGDDDNLAACQLAKQKFNVPEVIAKVNNPKNEHIFVKLGIDRTVDRVSLILEHIKLQIPQFSAIRLLAHRGMNQDVVLARPSSASPVIGKRIVDLSLPAGSLVSLIIRGGREPELPLPDSVLERGDQFICLLPAGTEREVQELLGISAPQRA